MDSNDYDVQPEVSRMNVIKYLCKLSEKLQETGFASEKSPIIQELEKLTQID
ncbi:hypothetical protein [Iningainema tapete]|uniref:Uncharacterized protein n=1 Tax=Iningainema tapete BLCC-T55 TaxID=2748662 RepID=A0A8J6XH86_9CYAN|nr:hypothetical protein [Iningainema tapete]MBD2772527.1 hypothetical protein [Iningainema tapete BLCC-T55]